MWRRPTPVRVKHSDDSFYAANILQGIWKAKGNLELVEVGRDLVATQIERCNFMSYTSRGTVTMEVTIARTN